MLHTNICITGSWLLSVFIDIVESAPRSSVIITGTTVGPDYDRKEGKAATECPDSHPTALSNGSLCCERYYRKNHEETNLLWEDPFESCPNKDFIECPDFPCVTHTKYRKPMHCPDNHPIQMDNGCCDHYLNKCNNEVIQPTDHPICCFNSDPFYPEICQRFKLKCLASNPKNPETYCPKNPLLERSIGRNYAIVAAPYAQALWKDVGQGECKDALGNRLTPNAEIILEIITTLKKQFPSLPQDRATVFMVALKKLTATSTCYSKTACQGKIIQSADNLPMDIHAEFGDIINTYTVGSYGIGIGIEITLSPQQINVVNIDYAQGRGAYLCLTKC